MQKSGLEEKDDEGKRKYIHGDQRCLLANAPQLRGLSSARSINLLTDARNSHVHEVGMLVILCGRIVCLKSLKEFTKNLLRDFTPSSF